MKEFAEPLWRPSISPQGSSHGVLLANNPTRLSRLCSMLWQMPTLHTFSEVASWGADFCVKPLALCQVGNWQDRPSPKGLRPSKICGCSNRLLYKVGGGRAASKNYRPEGRWFCLEKFYLPLWNTKQHIFWSWNIVWLHKIQELLWQLWYLKYLLDTDSSSEQRPSSGSQ